MEGEEGCKENVRGGKRPQDEARTGDQAPTKKQRKCGDGNTNEAMLKKQSDLIWELRRDLRDNLSKSEMIELLTENGQQPPKGDKMLDHLVDCMVFGSCLPCPECGGQLSYSSTSKSYKCGGQLSEYTKCLHYNINPQRKKFVIPNELKKKNAYLKSLKVNVLTKRVYNDALANEKVVSHSDQFKYLGSRGMKTNEIKKDAEGKSLGVGSGLSQQVVKAGTVVDQECEYADVSHVHRGRNGVLYSVVLGSADTLSNRNSYYKIQLLKHDEKLKFYLFRSWGRVGTLIGGTKTEVFCSEVQAMEAFHQ
ncbi:unnamed protein product [Strongylus vulgaris]|uniref:NAD(+) ADP-ribosyltransferase n=1 Tax=Strongylus vulgaris TaxID=40348 RepID=A0A3P7IID3_STRVU|nr:unnamed protein product [Strongylus vulgaris]